jgi:hypothetical protein
MLLWSNPWGPIDREDHRRDRRESDRPAYSGLQCGSPDMESGRAGVSGSAERQIASLVCASAVYGLRSALGWMPKVPNAAGEQNAGIGDADEGRRP